ncbi:hypothetical protein NW761_014169 [Fusarium oxysporum]|nr:hypothetical protein NW758_003877 [Fusarium oxysporum]KAJ4073573.1 hypothetical protein NW761_014169 [Fusarium oxysporum]WKT52791.1 hypothetical protein QSH57_003353 [Fusarium oxysporum f. sp. vasinfectum]
MDSEDIDEIHDEYSDVLQLLEDLVTYFGDGYGGMTTLQSFLQHVWLPRIEEIDEDKPILWNDPPIGLKGWMMRLDEIATDPERPVVEASESRIPNAPA